MEVRTEYEIDDLRMDWLRGIDGLGYGYGYGYGLLGSGLVRRIGYTGFIYSHFGGIVSGDLRSFCTSSISFTPGI